MFQKLGPQLKRSYYESEKGETLSRDPDSEQIGQLTLNVEKWTSDITFLSGPADREHMFHYL